MGVAGANAGVSHYNWKGGRQVHEGRVLIYAPDHPRARQRQRYVFEHVLVAERALGHYLPRTAVVHHVDLDSLHNANDNLAILQNRSEHMRLHGRLRVLRAGGNPWTESFCAPCGRSKALSEFPVRVHRDSVCRECRKAYAQRYRDDGKGHAGTPEQRRARVISARAWQMRNPEKKRAQIIAQRAVADGTLLVPTRCEQCPTVRVEAHHDDYSAPLVVRWLCRICHKRADRDRRQREAAIVKAEAA